MNIYQTLDAADHWIESPYYQCAKMAFLISAVSVLLVIWLVSAVEKDITRWKRAKAKFIKPVFWKVWRVYRRMK